MYYKKYDINSGFMFSTYAVWWIKQRISSYVAENYYKWTVGKDMYQFIKKINFLECQLSIKYGREVTREEIAKEYNVTNERIRQIESKALQKIRGRYSGRLKPYYDDND